MTGERPAPGADRPPTDPPPAAPTGVDRADPGRAAVDRAGPDRTGAPAGAGRRGAVPAGADAAAILAALKAAGQTVAVAESVTGGLLSAALSEPAGASAVFRGGLVVYATDLKASIAGVPAPLLAAEGPVSPDVAGALAAGARDRLAATYGLSLTGVAGPDRQEGIDVGVVYVGLAGPGGGEVRRLSLTGDRARIRAGSVAGALAVLAERLAVTAPDPRVPAVRRESAV